MRCKDVQKHLAIDARLSCLSPEARAHVLECHACRQAQALFTMIDRELREQPVWHPPAGFVGQTALRGLDSIRERPTKQNDIFQYSLGPAFSHYLQPILLGMLATAFCLLVLYNVNTVAAGYQELAATFSRAILDNPIRLAWVTGIISLSFTAWITQRALR